MRASGILLPVASLPSKYGIGSFSKSAYDFVDSLAEAGQKYWQILPLGPTGYGDSPYQSFSTFAGNPYYIDLDCLIEEGLLTEEECAFYDFGGDSRLVDYEKIYRSRAKVLKKAYYRCDPGRDKNFLNFKKENAFWLEDYSLFMAVKDHFGGVSWLYWDEDIRMRRPDSIAKYREELEEDIEFYTYLQFLFKKQWDKLKSYANKKGIQIIGDIPIYVAFDSADSWAHSELFQFDEEKRPTEVAGCPPDAFSPTGQLWGNPLYRWEYHKKTSYQWWMQRISYCFQLYDMIRIDHFRGFDEYYSIPYGNKTAENGKWRKGPGYEFFQQIHRQLGELNIIAEDLGFLTDSVRNLLKKTGFPGMKILQFAFDSREESDYLPHNYNHNCVVYTGTHDNDTTLGWYEKMNKEDKQFAIEYLNNRDTPEEEIQWDYIRLAHASVADLCIIPMQDYLGIGEEGRINTPSTLGNNWDWRMEEGEFTPAIMKKIKKMAALYGRYRESESTYKDE